MAGQKSTGYAELSKTLPFCPPKVFEVISRLIETGDLKQTAKEFGKSERYCQQAVYTAKRKLNQNGNKKQKTLSAKLLHQAGIDPGWLAKQKRNVILNDKSPVAALKAIQDCEEVFGLREVNAGIHIDTGPKLIINLGAGFDSLKSGGGQQESSAVYSPERLEPPTLPMRDLIDTEEAAKSQNEGLKSLPSAFSWSNDIPNGVVETEKKPAS